MIVSPKPPSTSPVRVVCECTSFGCKDKEYLDKAGCSQSGNLVAVSTRNKHIQRDRQLTGKHVSVSILTSFSYRCSSISLGVQAQSFITSRSHPNESGSVRIDHVDEQRDVSKGVKATEENSKKGNSMYYK